METREALLYSDGSLGIFPAGKKMADIEEERKMCDLNETKVERMTKIVRVSLEIVEVLFSPGGPDGVPLSEIERLRAENENLKRQLTYAKHCGA